MTKNSKNTLLELILYCADQTKQTTLYPFALIVQKVGSVCNCQDLLMKALIKYNSQSLRHHNIFAFHIFNFSFVLHLMYQQTLTLKLQRIEMKAPLNTYSPGSQLPFYSVHFTSETKIYKMELQSTSLKPRCGFGGEDIVYKYMPFSSNSC